MKNEKDIKMSCAELMIGCWIGRKENMFEFANFFAAVPQLHKYCDDPEKWPEFCRNVNDAAMLYREKFMPRTPPITDDNYPGGEDNHQSD